MIPVRTSIYQPILLYDHLAYLFTEYGVLFSGKVGCHLDRHENIGQGHIGVDGFIRLMNDKRLDDIPCIIETPMTLTDEEEIKHLYSMISDV